MEGIKKTHTFASLFKESSIRLDYGVMVAQQVLVLFVQVRILVIQRRIRLAILQAFFLIQKREDKL